MIFQVWVAKSTTSMKKYIFFRLTIVTNILYHVNLLSVLTDLLDGQAMLCVPPSSSVPREALCHTFSFAQTSISRLSSNTTLTFLAGNNQELLISNIHNFSCLQVLLQNLRALPALFFCQHQVSFKFKNVIKLWMKGIYFICYGNNSFLSVKIMINNSTFQGQMIVGLHLVLQKLTL